MSILQETGKQGGRHLPSLCVISASAAFTAPAQPPPATSTPTTQLIWGRRRGGGGGQWVGAQSRMQIHNQWNENTKDGGGGGSHVTCTYHPLPKCSGLHSSCRQMLNRTSADSSGLKRISEHPNNTKNSKQLKR